MGDPAKVFLRDPGYDGQLVRTLNMAVVHAADLGEALATARRVRRMDGSVWYDTWSQTAARAEVAGAKALAGGDPTSARQAWLRASEYHRQSYYFLRARLDDQRLQRAYAAHVAAFRRATTLMTHPAVEARIPYEGTSLHGYLFSPDDSGAVRPTVVLPAGYDSTAESGWGDVPAALERGYHALVFEGPGQGEALYVQRLFLRPDFENVLTPVLDWLLARPEVDPARVVLIGRSFAGYLAPRAAAFEHRVAALVCDPAQPELAARIPAGLAARVAAPVVKGQMRLRRNRAEFFRARMASHGVDSLEDWFVELRRFSMTALAPQITCPTLVVEAENDFAGGGGRALVDALTAPADLVRLTEAEGAGGHVGGLGQQLWAATVYPWLRRTLSTADAR